MKKFFLFIIVLFLLSFSLVAAVDVSTSKTDYNGGETVTVTISDCTGTSIVRFKNPGGDTVDIKSGEGSWSASYNTLSDSADGKYTVSATCTDGAAQNNFCVDAPGCVSQPASTGGGTAGKGGGACTPDWNCNTWSFCGPTSTQTRSCFDNNNCLPAKEETQPCQPCLESWICSAWAECSAGAQARACYDEHFCETTNLKPALQKGCNAADPIPPPARISNELPPPYVPKTSVVQQSFFSKLWDNYEVYIIGLAAAIVLAALIVLGLYYFKPKQVAYNLNELKQWVRKEKEMGTSDADIRQILKQNTGWNDEEIDAAFNSLQQKSMAVNSNASV